ncbi:hypothetical protein [Deinococcus sp. 23YEL01]|uniref:hypothetical protein n=1 Tax=Deinococcus sp. 23YEL01 TaxID=2745871 RepID=UPI001E63B8DE|nr:hypothetical protein [Deinococcus sp. 23YEL01]MCD0168024.1 hypothetical protein [Deinococcus sp. 23YEL01]
MMDSLFSTQTRLFPSQRQPRRAARTNTRDRHAERYGPTNPSIFHIILRDDLAPAPIKRDLPLHTLDQKDAFGEWRNAHDATLAPVLHTLLRLPNDYTHSVAHIRGNRPEQANEALKWWRQPTNRAHLINALLRREHRSVAQLHRDMRLKLTSSSRLHEYLHRWGVQWERPDRAVDLVDGSGTTYPARVITPHHTTGTAEVRLDAYHLTINARFDTRTRVYRTPDVLAVATLVPLHVAAAVLGLTTTTARTVLPITTHSAPARVPLIHPDVLTRTMPAEHWRTDLADALRDANPCRCAFWDHHARTCGIEHTHLPERGTAPYTCEDHARYA